MADVGLAHVVHASHIAELDALGTFAYAAPELVNGDKCNEKADIWSFGVLLHELITTEIPRRGKLRELRSGLPPHVLCTDASLHWEASPQESP